MANILVVDDAMFMRRVIGNILVPGGHNVIGEACNGKEAVELYKKLRPDIVTLDITMPIKTGLEALREIKEYDSKAKVLMCSAMGQQAMVIEAITGGALDFLVKPFNKDHVLEAIVKALSKS